MSVESKRQQRFGGVIQQDLAEIFLREGNAWFPGTMITVTRVRMTPDLGIARIYLSFFNAQDSDEFINKIRSRTKEIRYKLGKKIKDQAKNVPELEFFADDSLQYTEKMDRLFDEISKQPKQEDGE
jgi:ribosome-binding factor A